jgi:Elongation factor G, domain IV
VSELLQQWFKRKLGAGITPLPGIVTVTHEFDRVVGPRSVYAKVTLSISPNDTFVFESKVRWPDECDWDSWVIDGIIDALIGCQYETPLAARFELRQIAVHPVNSSPMAFYWAAKGAVNSVLQQQRQR